MEQSVINTIYLLSCAVNRTTPDRGKIIAMDLDAVYDITSRHMLSATAAVALKNAGVLNENFSKALAKAQRKAVIYEDEKEKSLSAFEAAGIWYMPLKGSVLKRFYPQFGMREMADIDILIDSSRHTDVKKIMEDLGFSVESFDVNNVDTYKKSPVTNIEIHKSLFGFQHERRFFCYYANIKDRLVKDKGNQYGYHFTPEDFYVYMIAHEYRHYQNRGTGLRSLLDTYVFLQKNELDEAYTDQEAEKLGITQFEKENRRIATALFAKNMIVDDEILEYYLSSGTFGTMDHFVENKMKKTGAGKLSYVFSRLYGTDHEDYWKYLKQRHPVVFKHKILLPLLPFIRAGHALKKNPKQMAAEIQAVMKR